ncbi:uncharacterized protein K452DRAFT_358148 [Aplosporella prunicola CBS 121167]|uniref:Uncharacterized protein n=1 Tax=Aplosporella prunicola CBS 121167 TaxID=1176127 RepID=A0A6A6BE21_9PEZI|nr:uncharacterized protein K452DRAFT_358148 [Aplosporella prunicola CBS 121167]KAF2142326.1 hypothetical protein K452DRAFT_358148 [Aplosporella prunicola CBS 121167]
MKAESTPKSSNTISDSRSVYSSSPLARNVSDAEAVELSELEHEDEARLWRGPGEIQNEYQKIDEIDAADGTAGTERPRVMRKSMKSAINDWWFTEFCAWTISATALAVVIGTIGVADGNLLHDLPIKITLNSFIAFMTTIMKATVLIPVAEGISQLKWLRFQESGILSDIQTFDEASRGLWGSLKLLFTTRGIHLAKLGAFLAIAGVAVEPFTQQAVTYPRRSVPMEDYNSTVTVAHCYNSYEKSHGSASDYPSLSMKSAIVAGLYDMERDPRYSFQVTATCPTSNCTWDQPYRSLAVCSKCADVTSNLRKTCDTYAGYAPICSYNLPSGFRLDGSKFGNAYMFGTGLEDTINFNNTQPTISSITTIRGHRDQHYNLTGAEANECVLYFCVQEYLAKSESGNYTEDVTATYIPDQVPVLGDDVVIKPPGNDMEYTVDASTWKALRAYFNTFWDGNVAGDQGRAVSENEALLTLYQLDDGGTGLGTSQPGAENETIGLIAKSMTKAIRTQRPVHISAYTKTSPCISKASGIILGLEAYVHVRWHWMILPIMLELLALAFLISTVIKSKDSGVSIWKSSTLPLLHVRLVDDSNQASVDDQNQARLDNRNQAKLLSGDVTTRGSGKLTDLNKWAMNSQVRLQRSNSGHSEFHVQDRRKTMIDSRV